MLKWLRSIDWIPILASALVLVFLLWFLAANPNYETYPTAYKNPFEYVFEWLSPEGWTALFTGVLTVSTILLWLETQRMASGGEEHAAKMERSIGEAAKAAVAMQGVADGMALAAKAMKDVAFQAELENIQNREASAASAEIAQRQIGISGQQTVILDKQKEIARQEFLITHRAQLEVRFVREVAGGIEITVINTGTGSAKFIAARAGIWHLLPGERFPSPHDLTSENAFDLRETFGPSESDRWTIVGRGDEFAEGFGSPAHIFGWIVYDTVGPTPVRRTTYFGRRTEPSKPELLPVVGSDWNFIQ